MVVALCQTWVTCICPLKYNARKCCFSELNLLVFSSWKELVFVLLLFQYAMVRDGGRQSRILLWGEGRETSVVVWSLVTAQTLEQGLV